MTIRTPYSQGWEAGYKGASRWANPYDRDWESFDDPVCDMADAWDRGWRDGQLSRESRNSL